MNLIIIFLHSITSKIKEDKYKSEFMLEGIIASTILAFSICINVIAWKPFGELGLEYYFFALLIAIVLGGWYYSYEERFKKITKNANLKTTILGAILTLFIFVIMFSKLIFKG